MEVFTGLPNQSADSVTHRNRKMGASRGRSEKNAIRICGDWSEQLSSKGKIYFYNCITEVSQWQKPPEWKLPDMNPDELLKLLARRSGHCEGKNLKRSRLSTMSSQMDVTNPHVSPKRPKLPPQAFVNGASYAEESSPNPPCGISRVNSGTASNCFQSSQHGNTNYSHQKTFECTKKPTASLTLKTLPTDDMEISPNSSPLSNTSSISNTNPSPCFSGSSRAHKYNHGNDQSRSNFSNKDSSGTLRQLVDVIRASIGGLLDSPSAPNSSANGPGNLKSRPQYTSELTFPATENVNCNRKSVGSTSSDQVTANFHHRPQRVDPNERLPNVTSHESDNSHPKAIPGLVSTLSTLVTLMGQSANSVTISDKSSISRSNPPPSLLQCSSSLSCSPSTPNRRASHCSENARSSSSSLMFTHPSQSVASSTFDPVTRTTVSGVAQDVLHSPRYNQPERTKFHSDTFLTHSSPSNNSRTPVHTHRRGSDTTLVGCSSVNSEDAPPRRSSGPLDNSDRLSFDTSSRCQTGLNGRHPSPSSSGFDTLRSPAATSSVRQPSYSDTGNPAAASSATSQATPINHDDDGNLAPVLDSVSTAAFLDRSLISKFSDKIVEGLEQTARREALKFEQLHSVLYGELSVESKKLHALVRVSETSLAILEEKQTTVQNLVELIENRAQLRNPSLTEDSL